MMTDILLFVIDNGAHLNADEMSGVSNNGGGGGGGQAGDSESIGQSSFYREALRAGGPGVDIIDNDNDSTTLGWDADPPQRDNSSSNRGQGIVPTEDRGRAMERRGRDYADLPPPENGDSSTPRSQAGERPPPPKPRRAQPPPPPKPVEPALPPQRESISSIDDKYSDDWGEVRDLWTALPIELEGNLGRDVEDLSSLPVKTLNEQAKLGDNEHCVQCQVCDKVMKVHKMASLFRCAWCPAVCPATSLVERKS